MDHDLSKRRILEGWVLSYLEARSLWRILSLLRAHKLKEQARKAVIFVVWQAIRAHPIYPTALTHLSPTQQSAFKCLFSSSSFNIVVEYSTTHWWINYTITPLHGLPSEYKPPWEHSSWPVWPSGHHQLPSLQRDDDWRPWAQGPTGIKGITSPPHCTWVEMGVGRWRMPHSLSQSSRSLLINSFPLLVMNSLQGPSLASLPQWTYHIDTTSSF